MTNTDSCAACGKLRSDLPLQMVNGEEVQRFALHDEQRALDICSEDLELYEVVITLATQEPMLRDLPELMQQLQGKIDSLSARGHTLYKKMIAPA